VGNSSAKFKIYVQWKDGDWAEVDKLSLKPLVKNHKSFLYSVYKTQYLEYIDHHETQKVYFMKFLRFLCKKKSPF
jgi:hypothetical protein